MTTQTNGGWIENIPQVEIELLEGGNVRVTDKTDMNGDHSVDLHPSQLRLIAEKLGLVREVTASEAAMREKLQSEINGLERDQHRLQSAVLAIRDRTEQLFKDLCLQHDHGHEDLTLEVAKCAALTDIIELAIVDFKDDWDITERQTYGKSDKPAIRNTTPPLPATAPATPATDMPKAWNWAISQQLEKSSTKFLLVTMAFLAGENERCSASVQELAAKTAQDRKTVLEGLKRLSDAGLIVDTGERSGATKSVAIYRLATDLNYESPKTGQLNLEGDSHEHA